MFKEGLVRFASERYTNDLDNKFSHLTNYSLNKKNEKQDDENDLKWPLKDLTKALEEVGVNMDILWSNIYDVIIKSIISVDHHIYNQT